MAIETFHESISTPLPASALWTLFTEAVEDTDKVAWWPSRLNRVVIPTLRAETPFTATYRLGGVTTSRLPYRVIAVGPEHFIYSPAEGHPFRGEIDVRAVSAPEGSTLCWGGRYEMSALRPERLFFRTFFLPRFFGALRTGLDNVTSSRTPGPPCD